MDTLTNSGSMPDSAETAVRNYLLYIEDPDQLRDEALIEKAQQAADEAKDPITKLKALSDLERARNIEEEGLRKAFITHAKTYAAEQGIPLEAFRSMGIKDAVLHDAGFDVPSGRRGRGRGTSSSSEPRQRAKAVPVAEIKTYVMSLDGTFVLNDIRENIGGSVATVRKAVDELIEEGKVDKLGPVLNWSGRGRAPIEYKKR